MGKRYELTAAGLLSEIPYRVDIYDPQYSSAVQTLVDDRQSVQFETGERADIGRHPIRPRLCTIGAIETSDLSPIFGAEDRRFRVEVYRTDTGSQVYEGYLLTDQYQDAPLGPQPDTVTIEATDGLPLLRDIDYDDTKARFFQPTYVEAIGDILEQLFTESGTSPLKIQYVHEWYPYAEGDQLSSSTLPLSKLSHSIDNYRENRPNGAAFYTMYDALVDMLTSQGLTIQQKPGPSSRPVWRVRQRSAIEDTGDVKVWTYDNLVLDSGPTTENILVSLDGRLLELDNTGDFVQRRETVEVVYDHEPVTNVVANPSFEAGGATLAQWTITDIAGMEERVEKYSDPNNTFDEDEVPDPTASNERFFLIRYDPTTIGTSRVEFPLAQTIPFQGVAEGVDGVLQWNGVSGGTPERIDGRIECRVGGSAYLGTQFVFVRQRSLKGDVELPVTPTTHRIPKGARLPVEDGSGAVKAVLQLTEEAEDGAETLVGTLSATVEAAWSVRFLGFVSSQQNVALLDHFATSTLDVWGGRTLQFAWEDSNGQPVEGDIRLRFGAELEFADQITTRRWFFDTVRLSLQKNGQPLDETAGTATVDTTGAKDTLTSRLGDGPSPRNNSRLRLKGETGTVFDITGDWKVGAYSGGSRSGVSLAELHARERLRYMRNNNRRLRTAVLPDGPFTLDGHELIELGGTTYTIQHLREEPAEGRMELELLRHNDYGTS